MTEQATLRQHQEQLRLDREAIARDMKKLEAYGAEIQQGSKEIEQITEVCTWQHFNDVFNENMMIYFRLHC